MNKQIDAKTLKNMNYPDFVGAINQWNVLPGSFVTLSKWIQYAGINKDSNILQVACTTGFQAREIACLTGCRGEAFDLSEYAIESAKYNKEHYAPDININYSVQNGYDYNAKEKFSHVIVGGGLQFFPDPKKMKDKCIEFIKDGGYLLASPFYIKEEIPQELIEKAKKVFGITVTIQSYKEIMKMYTDLEIIYEDRNDLIMETEEEIKEYCRATTERAVKILNKEDDKEIYNVIYDRLYSIKEMSNKLRPYQMYSVLVLRYRKNIYPNRYVELF